MSTETQQPLSYPIMHHTNRLSRTKDCCFDYGEGAVVALLIGGDPWLGIRILVSAGSVGCFS